VKLFCKSVNIWQSYGKRVSCWPSKSYSHLHVGEGWKQTDTSFPIALYAGSVSLTNGRGRSLSKFWDPHYNFWTNRDIGFKFGTDIDHGPLLRPDHKMTPKWPWPGSRDQISKFWDPPYHVWTNWAIRLKIGTDIEDRPLLHPDHKTTPKWAWPGSRDQISKFSDTPYNCGTKRVICFKFGTDIDDGPLLRRTKKWPLSGRGRGHVTKFRNFGTPL